jgi:hydroxypyruvate isomerase
MKRRDFASILGASLLIPSFSKGATMVREKPFELNYAPHFGMFKNHAGPNELDQLQFMYDQGFTALEDNELMGRPVALQEQIGEKLAKLNMKMGVFVIKFDGFFDKQTMTTGKKEWTDLFLSSCRKAVETSKRVNAKWATVVPGNFTRELPLGIQTGNVIDNLKRAAEILEPAGLTMVLEPLSDNSDLFLRYSDQTYSICRAVDSPSCKILFDMYHMQRNEGNLIANMDKCWNEIAYIQIGDNPGRKEPTTGEVNYQNIFRYIKQKGFTGVLGMEHGNSKPGKEGELALIEAYRKSDL